MLIADNSVLTTYVKGNYITVYISNGPIQSILSQAFFYYNDTELHTKKIKISDIMIKIMDLAIKISYIVIKINNFVIKISDFVI